MSATQQPAVRLPLLFLIADTGGGHRSAARAVGQALDRMYPGRFDPVLCDPLGGPGSVRLLRRVTGLYGPAIRLAPWLWGAAYHVSDSRPAAALLARTLLRLADGPAVAAARAHGPAAIVSFHPLTGAAAAAARDRGAPGVPVLTVVTDLAAVHAAWRHGDADLIIAPCRTAADLPVTRDFWGGPARRDERAALRRSLGLREDRFLIVVTGGGEGSGGLAGRTAAILRRFANVHVVVICGRNRRLRRRLGRLAAAADGRLTVTGFVANMADWLRCCDLVVTKAGPGTIAEAACCGAPMLLTSHVPGQERGNAQVVAAAGAGLRARGTRRLLAAIGRLRADPGLLAAMRAASARLGRPAAAAGIAGAIAGLAAAEPGPGDRRAPAENAVLTALSARSAGGGSGAARGAGGGSGAARGPAPAHPAREPASAAGAGPC